MICAPLPWPAVLRVWWLRHRAPRLLVDVAPWAEYSLAWSRSEATARMLQPGARQVWSRVRRNSVMAWGGV